MAERFRRANSHPGTTAEAPSNSAGPLLSPPSIQYEKVSFPSSSGEDQPEGVPGCLGVSLEKCVVSPNNEVSNLLLLVLLVLYKMNVHVVADRLNV